MMLGSNDFRERCGALFDLNPADIEISLEFFPPKSEAAESAFWQTLSALEAFAPSFVSITCGAGGGSPSGTRRIVENIAKHTALRPAAHLTCVGASREDVDEKAREYWNAGVRNIVALRGDKPKNAARGQAPRDSYVYASELVAGLRRIADFDISVAAYPEKHPEARSLDDDIDNLKRKIDAGASRAITQFFFDSDVYFRFLEKARARGVEAPIVPGILPIVNFPNVVRFSEACGASVPDWLRRLFQDASPEPGLHEAIGAIVLAEQVRQLVAGGVRAFHIYTLNRATLASTLGHLLGLGAQSSPTRPTALCA